MESLDSALHAGDGSFRLSKARNRQYHVGDLQCIQIGFDRNLTERIIAAANRRIEWRLLGAEKVCGRHHGNSRLGERLLQYRTRTPIKLAIPVGPHEESIL